MPELASESNKMIGSTTGEGAFLEASKCLCEFIDWDHPGLAASGAHAALKDGSVVEAARLLVRHLRSRPRLILGFERDTILAVRSRSTPVLKNEARALWECALASELLMPYHSNAFAALGAETIILAEDPDLCRRMAQKILNERPQWEDGLFGVTHGICDLLRMLWSLPECSDDDLIPVLGWILVRYPKEWEWVKIWSERTLSPTGHNWWAHALPGFWMLGVFFPEFRGVDRFASLGTDYLERELRGLFEDDGWTKEGSPGYHEFAFSSLLTMADLAVANGIRLSPSVEQMLSRIADCTWRLALPDCGYPMFGDWVRGNAYVGFVGQWRPDRHLGNLLRARAARFGNPLCKFVAESLDANHCLSGREDLVCSTSPAALAYDSILSPADLAPDSALPASGYYVMRTNWTNASDCLAFTAASIGPTITSHKHADLMSFELYSRGRRILVDNGYGAQDSGEPRMWRVSTAAHNTTDVDGQDQTQCVSEFRYAPDVTPQVEAWATGERFAYLSAYHEGYRRLKNPVCAVRRKIFWLRGEYWILLDRFTTGSSEAHDYGIHFHVGVPCSVSGSGQDIVTSGEGGNLLIHPILGINEPPTVSENPYPLTGYENPARVRYLARGKGDWVVATLLVPFSGDNVPEISSRVEPVICDGAELTPWQATALSIDFLGRTDLFLNHHMAWNLPWECGGSRGIRRVYHSECPELNEKAL